jgi:hypothetical protein
MQVVFCAHLVFFPANLLPASVRGGCRPVAADRLVDLARDGIINAWNRH